MKLLVPGTGSVIYDIVGYHDGEFYAMKSYGNTLAVLTVSAEILLEITAEEARTIIHTPIPEEEIPTRMIDPSRMHECNYWHWTDGEWYKT